MVAAVVVAQSQVWRRSFFPAPLTLNASFAEPLEARPGNRDGGDTGSRLNYLTQDHNKEVVTETSQEPRAVDSPSREAYPGRCGAGWGGCRCHIPKSSHHRSINARLCGNRQKRGMAQPSWSIQPTGDEMLRIKNHKQTWHSKCEEGYGEGVHGT